MRGICSRNGGGEDLSTLEYGGNYVLNKGDFQMGSFGGEKVQAFQGVFNRKRENLCP